MLILMVSSLFLDCEVEGESSFCRVFRTPTVVALDDAVPRAQFAASDADDVAPAAGDDDDYVGPPAYADGREVRAGAGRPRSRTT